MNREPVRLHRQEEFTLSDRIDAWCSRHITLCLTVALIIFSVLFVMLCFAVVGVSALESGGMRNFVNGGWV